MTYKELYERRKITYASQYEDAIAEENMEKAYKVIGKLMKFHMISPEDKILSKANFKKFEKAGIDTEHRFDKDYRKDSDYLPDNLFFDVPNHIPIDIVSEKHWGKRVELVYEGDIIVPERTYRFDIREKTSPTTANGALNAMKDLYRKESGGLELKVDWKEALELGNAKIYDVSLGNGQQFVFRNLGYVYVAISNKKARLYTLLCNSDMIKTFINIKKAYDTVASALIGGLVEHGINVENIESKPLCDVKKAREFQAKKYSKQPPLDYAKFCEIENRKIAELAAAKENE